MNIHISYQWQSPNSNGYGDCIMGKVTECPAGMEEAGHWLRQLKGRLSESLRDDGHYDATVVVLSWQRVG